jgi:hypothetical protein
MAEAGKAHGKPDGRRRLSFAKWSWINGGYQYILAKWRSLKTL